MQETIVTEVREKVNAGAYDEALAAIAAFNPDHDISYRHEMELQVAALRCHLAKNDITSAKAAADAIIQTPEVQLRVCATRYAIAPFVDALLNYLLAVVPAVGYTSTALDPYRNFISTCGDLDNGGALALFRVYDALWLNEADYAGATPKGTHFQKMLDALDAANLAKIPTGHEGVVKMLASIARIAATTKDAATQAQVGLLTANLV